MNEQRLPLAALAVPPLPQEDDVRQLLVRARSGFAGKLVVLDDDPTGIQTVHDVPVYTDWSRETLLRGLREAGDIFFVLTNSRSFSREETERVHREIAGNLAWAAEQADRPFLLLSRGDSTLRGHWPLETETLRQELEHRTDLRFNGEILMPYFAEGGRYTIHGVHYVRTGQELVPAGQTEFARDATFGYHASELGEWCQEMTQGRCPAASVVHITLEELRSMDVDGITAKLMAARDFTRYAVDAADDRDVEIFVAALLRAIAGGKHYLFRCAAGLVRVLGGVEKRPLLTGEELESGRGPGLVLVGSHVKKTTMQLECLLEAGLPVEPVCFDVSCAGDGQALLRERDRVLADLERTLRAGRTAVVYTSRKLLRVREGQSQDNLAISVRISQALSSLAALLTVRPGYIVAKGGITSSDVGVKGLGVRRAWVMGQLLPGIPVWRTGPESRFPGLPYVIFPGNVGDTDSLRRAVEILETGRTGEKE